MTSHDLGSYHCKKNFLENFRSYGQTKIFKKLIEKNKNWPSEIFLMIQIIQLLHLNISNRN